MIQSSGYDKIFQKMRKILKARMENLWDCTDEEVLKTIDDLLLEESRKEYLTIERRIGLRRELFYAIRKMDVLEELLQDDSITEIMVNGWEHIFIEQEGRLFPWERHFTSPEKLEDVVQQIAARCNRVVNTLHPIVDARLDSGERVNAVIAPAALNGPILTIRKFPKDPITMDKLIELGSITQEAADFLKKLVTAGYTILIGGGTGSGKTTFLNALSGYIPADERLITIEDNAELQIQGIENLVRLECRQANAEQAQEITIGDLLKTSLRMRPSRIIVGEVRAAEAAELLQAVNVGHDGSISTIHANSCTDMAVRLETMALMGAVLPESVIRRQIVSGFDIFIYLGRMRDKSRKLLEIAEIDRIEEGKIMMNPVFVRKKALERTGKLIHREKLEKAGIECEEEST